MVRHGQAKYTHKHKHPNPIIIVVSGNRILLVIFFLDFPVNYKQILGIESDNSI